MKFLWRISILMMLIITLSPATNAAPGDVKWTYDAGGYLYAADLSVAQDGTAYLGRFDFQTYSVYPLQGGIWSIPATTNLLTALDPAGHIKWQYPGVGQNPIVRKDGRVLSSGIAPQFDPTGSQVTNVAKYVQGINPDGTPWLTYTNGIGAALTSDDSVIVSINAIYYDEPIETGNFSSYGLVKASFTNASQVITNQNVHSFDLPLIAPDGSMFSAKIVNIAPHSYHPTGPVFEPFIGYFYAFDRFGGLKWRLSEPNVDFSSLAICTDGSVCVGTRVYQENPDLTTYQLQMISPDGTTKWTASGSGTFTPAVIDNQNNIYVGSGRKLVSYTPLGGVRWQTDFPSTITRSPALAANGTLYVALGNALYTVSSSNGTVISTHDIGRGVTSAPIISSDGTVYLLAEYRYLFAIEGNFLPADSPWPQYRHDAQRTGRARQLDPVNVGQRVDGKFSLTLLLEPGKTYKVEASEDLVTWVEIGSFTSSGSAQSFLDETSAGKPQRFYRLVLP